MSLPGKLSVCILEEDNPQKSYFRLKPLLVESGGRFVPYADEGAYPSQGCIRVVPDKNESFHFKARMRRMGLFCMVDLRQHPADNDKIRPNKNYREGSGETNAYIIYSDVVKEPAPGVLFEVIDAGTPGALRPRPRTASVLLRDEDGAPRPECYAWESARDAEGWVHLHPNGEQCDLDAAQLFDLEIFNGERVAFAVLPQAKEPAPHRSTAHAAPPPKPEAPAPEKPDAPAPQPDTPPTQPDAPGSPAQPEDSDTAAAPEPPKPAGSDQPAPEAPDAPEAAPDADPAEPPEDRKSEPPKPEPDAPEDRMSEPPKPESSQPEPARKPPERPAKPPRAAQAPEAPAGDKPWLHHDATMVPRPVDPRLSPAQRNLAAQSGLNPRRGRSLQELIDEKWQQSRLNQLGLAIAPVHTGAPVSSPVDSAVDAVRQAWSQPQLRDELLSSLGEIEEFGASLEECRQAARERDIERHLDGLEARRLKLLSELDHLSLKDERVRGELKAQLMREADAELKEASRRADEAKKEQAEFERLAEEARAAAQDARKAVDQLTGEALEQQLTQFALSEHMVERMRLIKAEAEAVPPAEPTLQQIDLNALAVRVMNRLDARGFAITRTEALNLCACAAISPVLILSGPVGSGKTDTARLLAEALGLTTLNRFVTVAPGKGPITSDARLDALEVTANAPALILLDDANLYPNPDPMRGLNQRLKPQWRLFMTVQDGGSPLPAHTLDRGFTLRLEPRPAAPWRPRPQTACPPEAPASLALAIPDAPLPAAMDARMDALRTGLARCGATVSRRALDDAWRYCALMRQALGDAADPTALIDRAVAQRILPALIPTLPPRALPRLATLLEDLPRSQSLLKAPLPIEL